MESMREPRGQPACNRDYFYFAPMASHRLIATRFCLIKRSKCEAAMASGH
jgi:hypothetical protein